MAQKQRKGGKLQELFEGNYVISENLSLQRISVRDCIQSWMNIVTILQQKVNI